MDFRRPSTAGARAVVVADGHPQPLPITPSAAAMDAFIRVLGMGITPFKGLWGMGTLLAGTGDAAGLTGGHREEVVALRADGTLQVRDVCLT